MGATPEEVSTIRVSQWDHVTHDLNRASCLNHSGDRRVTAIVKSEVIDFAVLETSKRLKVTTTFIRGHSNCPVHRPSS
jgi:hypothetical protein